MGYLFWAYMLIWIGIAAYVFWTFRRVQKVDRRLDAMEQALTKRKS